MTTEPTTTELLYKFAATLSQKQLDPLLSHLSDLKMEMEEAMEVIDTIEGESDTWLTSDDKEDREDAKENVDQAVNELHERLLSIARTIGLFEGS